MSASPSTMSFGFKCGLAEAVRLIQSRERRLFLSKHASVERRLFNSRIDCFARDRPIASDSICPLSSQFLPNIYRLTPVLIAPRVKLSGVKPRWLSYLSRFLTLPSVTDSPVSAAFTSQSL